MTAKPSTVSAINRRSRGRFMSQAISLRARSPKGNPNMECPDRARPSIKNKHLRRVAAFGRTRPFAADLVDKYRGDYFVFSGGVHASTGGIIMQENQIGAGHALQTLLFIIVYAAAGFVQAIQTITPQAHIDESTRLINRLLKLIKTDVFRELDGDLDES